MRILTPSEQRQIEQIKRTATFADCNIEIRDENREMWFNCLQMILETQEALKTAWNRSPNPQIDFIQTGKGD